MDEELTTGRTPMFGQALAVWRGLGGPRTWRALARELGGLEESACLLRWPDTADAPMIEEAGAQAVLACGTPLAGQSAEALTPCRADVTREVALALSGRQPFTVEDDMGDPAARRIVRLYLPLDETPPAVACVVTRID